SFVPPERSEGGRARRQAGRGRCRGRLKVAPYLPGSAGAPPGRDLPPLRGGQRLRFVPRSGARGEGAPAKRGRGRCRSRLEVAPTSRQGPCPTSWGTKTARQSSALQF